MTVPVEQQNPVSAISEENQIVSAASAALRNRRPIRDPRLTQAAAALQSGDLDEAERQLNAYLDRRPENPHALHLLGETAIKLGQKARAAMLLQRCVAVAPDYDAGRFSYACALYQLNRLDAALAEIERLEAADPNNVLFLDLKAAVLTAMDRHHDSMLCRSRLVDEHPESPELWVKYAKAIHSIGQGDRAIDALKRAIALDPACGDAWWTLADTKIWRFSEDEIAAMEAVLAKADKEDRVYLHFALGRAHGHRKNYPKSFDHYARANAMKRLTIVYDPDWLSGQAAKLKALFTPEFFAERAGSGSVNDAPIFVVGMQRAGSTLVEQILGSHSAIEATAELPDIALLAESLGGGAVTYPDVLATLDASVLRKLGERYLQTTKFRRVRGLAHFIDKNPYNFLHIGLLRLILPKAKVIDVRRHPLACCWSNFSAHFEMGALFAYRFGELARAYSDYVDVMAHFDTVLPGFVYRLIYEDLVADPEKAIRRLLAYLALPFEEACLAFHANPRAMNSVSSEQVRRPIYGESVEQWRNYEPWLGPLKSALGPMLDHWR